MYWGRENVTEVLREIEKVIHFKNITHFYYYFGLAILYIDIGDMDKMSCPAKKITDPWLKILLEADVHRARQEWDRAIALYKRYLQRFPGDRSLFGYLCALCYYEKGELNKAVEEINASQESYDRFHYISYAIGFYLLGKIYDKKADKQKAIDNYHKFLELWKEADEDLPDLIEAQKRLTHLQEAKIKIKD
jgi:tetratricopeptide (TPR) repeat protein